MAVSGSVETGNQIDAVARKAKGLDTTWKTLGSKLAAGFSIAAITSFGKQSLDFAGQFQDMSDQFGLSAGKLSGLTQAFQNVGGNAQNVEGVLRKLQEGAAEAGVSMEDYTAGVMKAYASTGDFSKLIEEVGIRNAAKFAAVIRETGGEFANLKGPVDSATAALADFYGDKAVAGIHKIRGFFAKGAVEAATFFEAYAKGGLAILKGDFSGNAFVDVYKKQNEQIRENIRLQKQSSDAAIKAAEDLKAEAGTEGDIFAAMSPVMPFLQMAVAAGASVSKLKAGLTNIAGLESSGRRDDRVSGAITAGSVEAAGLLARIRSGGTADQRVAVETLSETKQQTKLLQDIRDSFVSPSADTTPVFEIGP